MKTIKILIAGVLVLLAASTLTGCKPGNRSVSEIGIKRISAAREIKKSVSLAPVVTQDKEGILVRLMLNNPEKKPITSVQTWLTYNPKVLQGVSIDTKKTPFELTAPDGNGFDQNAGLVMIGRSTAKAVADTDISVAEVRFKKIGEGAVMIETYDYRSDLSGHTSANMMDNGTPINLLVKPQIPLVIVNQ